MAREFKVKAIIEGEDRASPAVDKARGSLERLGSFIASRFVITLGDLINIVRGIVNIFGEWITASAEQEQATARLISSLAGVTPNVTDATEALLRQADALQQTSRFSDDAVVSAQSLLATFNVLPDQLEQATQASADLAAALGIDIVDAARQVGSTTSGMIRTVAKLVPELKNLSAEALASGEGIELLAEALAGRAAAEAETFGGKLAILRNLLGELGETIGNAITQNVALGDAFERISAGADTAKTRLAPLVVAIDGIVTAVVRLGEALVTAAAKFTEWNLAIARVIDSIAAWVGASTGLEQRILSSIAATEQAIASNQGLTGALRGVAGVAQEVSNRSLESAGSIRQEAVAAQEAGGEISTLTVNSRALGAEQSRLKLRTDALRNSLNQAAAAAATFNAQIGGGVRARSGRPEDQALVDEALAAGRQPILGGTRVRTLDGGSRLVGPG